MNNIFAVDLGTNSIGWALRNPNLTENQIKKFGVLIFNKGVGNGKIGEYSYAAERTKRRSTRRLYQARKYRLWATLQHLINDGYCPLTIEDLNKWRHYDKEEARKNNNAGRIYPVDNIAFDAWIKLDFNNDGKPDYISPYQLRKELAEKKLDFNKEENRFKLGRALYHIAQRRGFKSSRKIFDDINGTEFTDDEVMDLQYSEKKKNKVISELLSKYDAKTIGCLFALLETDKIRIREAITQYAIRENYKDEIKFIFNFQKLSVENSLYSKLVETGKNKNNGSVFYKRPLRSQKGLVGKCTLEPHKYRIPISHPAFEIFRAWSFLNNIKYKDQNSGWAKLSNELKQDIYQKFFFRKSKSYFSFYEIIDYLKKQGKNWEFNYKPKTTVTACPVSARLKDIFGNDYLNVKIVKEKAPKSDKAFYDLEDIWHVLFSYEDQEYVAEFAEKKLKLDAKDVEQFIIAWNSLPVGYGMLSYNAINKINIFLQKGLIYTEAVLLANIPEIIGWRLWQENEQLLLDSISDIIDENRSQKIILNVVNNLISKYKNSEDKFGYKDTTYKLVESDFKDIQTFIEECFGKKNFSDFIEEERKIIFETIKDCYQAFFTTNGLVRNNDNEDRIVIIQSQGKSYHKTETGYYKLPKLIDTLKEFLKINFDLSYNRLNKIYHPSEINIYPPPKADNGGCLKLGSPKTGSFKNPMAMRTLHELRKLMNYMIETNQIDSDTRIVVEVARELNDANKRWAIEAWQRQRQAENQEFAQAIRQLLSEEHSLAASAENNDDIDKVRLFYEQGTDQLLPAIVEGSEEPKNKKKYAEKDEAVRWIGHGKKLIEKYRLWKEQGYQCLYTGKLIKITDLFNENIIDFEHTVPRSQSFDNSLANLTVCYHDYNRTIKKNQIPTQLNNYDKSFDFGGNVGKCDAILPRLQVWVERVERIKQQIDFWKTKSKKATDKPWKDDAIRQRHLWQMELEYWQNKLDRFTIKEVTTGFKNSQKIDTQLISKYAFHYLKSYFEKVDVQKGSITSEFRKIYNLQAFDEKKDRSKHSHHAKDAAVLTLIPIAVKRDNILERYYFAKENKTTFAAELPFKGFKREFIWNIDDNILINNITKNQSLTPAKRKVRKRGKELIVNGKIRWATGDAIRGQLHQDTFYGAIKPAKIGDKGNLLKDENGKFIQEEKEKFVLRVPFQYKKDSNTPGFKTLEEIEKQVVDHGLKNQIKKQVQEAGGIKEAFEKGIYLLDKKGNPHGNKIRHIRVWASVSEPLAIKKQTNLSEKEYKQFYWAANGENVICAYYKNDILDKNKKNKKDRELEIISLFDVAKLKTLGLINNGKIELYKKDKANNIIIDDNGNRQIPFAILKPGMKVIFYDENSDELNRQINEDDYDFNKRISDRIYKIVKFSGSQITFLHHLDSRDEKQQMDAYPENDFFKIDHKGKELTYGKRGKNGFTEKIGDYKKHNKGKPWHKLLYTKDWLDFVVENHHFKIEIDGTIKWIK